MKAGPEFPPEWQVKPVKILRALYGLKRSGASCRANFSKTLVNELHFQKSQADPEVWIRPAVRDDGFEYYKMILVYVDDILCVSEHLDTIMDLNGEFYLIKDGDTDPPKIYLGANIGKVQTPTGKEV